MFAQILQTLINEAQNCVSWEVQIGYFICHMHNQGKHRSKTLSAINRLYTKHGASPALLLSAE